MSTVEELLAQNRVLRERLEQLQQAAPEHVDPMIRAVFENAPAFLNVITPDGRSISTGRTSEAFGSVIGRTVFEFTDPAEHAMMREVYARVCATKQPVVYESVGYGENGEPNHTYIVRAVPVVDHGSVEAIILVPTDITERVRLERSLAQSQQQLRLAVDASHVGLWSWDLASNRVTWDSRLLEIYGIVEPPADYDRYLEHIHSDDRPLVQRVVERALSTGVYVPVEHRLTPRSDGVERWVLGTGTLLRDAGGKATVLMGGCLDISEQKRAATQLQRAQRVENLGQLVAGLAHNFNNLLGVIMPNLELSLEGASAEQAPMLDAAMKASAQARDLIKRLMSIPGGGPVSGDGPCDVGAVIERAVGICRSTFPREIELTVAGPLEVACVAMPASDLDQVVLNLLFNARDALERAQARRRVIELSVERVEGVAGDAPQIALRVRDNGVGMSSSVRARLFEPFFTTKPGNRGSGLGLADALMRVRAASGTLECESREGEGTTFVLRVPEAQASPKPPAVIAAPSGSLGETVLIVDDEPAVSAAVARLLRRQGYAVLEALDADQARATLAANGAVIRLVLLDHSMPNESGPEALPSLRALTDAPIVLFTGGVAEVPPGAAGLLQKPVETAELLQMVRDTIARARLSAATR
ncbi:MAG TPA: PAS domain S-box protein [Polyangia bacterium]|nr:PAS domain S-box protein [Polyangia bacterium]